MWCLLALLGTLLPSSAAAFWTGGGAASAGAGSAAATGVTRGATPTVSSRGSGAVRVRWGASQTGGGRTIGRYVVVRHDAVAGTSTPAGGGCAGVVAATTCLETGLGVGTWTYSVTPLLGTHWRGSEGTPSGEVSSGAAAVRLGRTVLGAPLPSTLAGTLTGFVPGEGINVLVDGVATTGGAPTVVDAAGAATFVFDLPAGLADGSHAVRIVGDDPLNPSTATTSVLVDTIAPTMTGTNSPPANAAGWNNSDVRLTGAVSDGDGSGYAATYYTLDGSDPSTSPSAQLAGADVIVTASATVRFVSVDVAGNRTPVVDAVIQIDRVAPLVTFSAAEQSGGVFADQPHGTVYYRGADAGSFRLLADVTDPGGSGAASFSSPEHAATSIGFSHVAGTFTTPVGGPYLDNAVTWVAGTSSSPVPVVSVADVAGNVTTVNGRILPDDVAPAGGFVQVAGVPAGVGAYATTPQLRVSMVDATDGGSGLLTGGRRLLRATAPLTAVNQRVECGAYGAFVLVDSGQGASFDDTVPAGAACYRYRVESPDNVGNVGRFESNEIRVQASADAALTPSGITVSAVGGPRYQSTAGSIVYYNPAFAGSFAVDASASDRNSGVSSFVFPALGGFEGGGTVGEPTSGGAWRMTYAWSANAASPAPGLQALSAVDGAGLSAVNSAAFDVRRDDIAPVGAAVTVTGLAGTGARYATSRSLTLAVSRGTDGGSGLDAGAARLARASASLISDGSSNGVCGTFGDYTPVVQSPAATLVDVVPSDATCYRYRYTAVDQVANEVEAVSVDVKVQTVAPATTVGISGEVAAAWSSATSTVHYRPSASSGSFTVTALASDAAAGIASYGFPTLPAGWSSNVGSAASRTYGWNAPTPSAPSGSQAISATSHAGLTGAGSFAVVADPTAPAGGAVTYAAGLRATASVAVTVSTGTDAGSGVDVASGELFRRSAPLVGGVCGTYGVRVDVAASSTTSETIVDSAVVSGACNRYEFDVADRVGNLTTYASSNTVVIDTLAPVQSLTLTAPVNASVSGNTIFFRGGVAGSFRIADATSDTSVVTSVAFPAAAATGFTHNAETVLTSTAGVFTSTSFSFTSTAAAPTARTLTATDDAGNIGTQVVTFVRDATAPSGGSVSYTNGVVNELRVALNLAAGTDLGSGLAAAGPVVRRAAATYNASSQACGAFGAFATVASAATGADTTVLSGDCYMYQLVVTDAVGNSVTYTSAAVVRVDMSGPRVTAIASQQSSGAAGNGRLEVGDKLVLTFNQALSTSGALSSYPGTLDSVGGGNVLISIPGLTASPRSTGSAAYLAAPGTTASFNVTPALVNNGASTTLTLTVSSLAGATTGIGQGALVWMPAASITNLAGSPANSTFTTSATFRLF